MQCNKHSSLPDITNPLGTLELSSPRDRRVLEKDVMPTVGFGLFLSDNPQSMLQHGRNLARPSNLLLKAHKWMFQIATVKLSLVSESQRQSRHRFMKNFRTKYSVLLFQDLVVVFAYLVTFHLLQRNRVTGPTHCISLGSSSVNKNRCFEIILPVPKWLHLTLSTKNMLDPTI